MRILKIFLIIIKTTESKLRLIKYIVVSTSKFMKHSDGSIKKFPCPVERRENLSFRCLPDEE